MTGAELQHACLRTLARLAREARTAPELAKVYAELERRQRERLDVDTGKPRPEVVL